MFVSEANNVGDHLPVRFLFLVCAFNHIFI